MSDEKQYTEEDMQRARREGFAAGARHQYNARYTSGEFEDAVAAQARKRYPIKKRVPREVRLAGGVVLRWDDGHLRFIDPDDRKPYPLTCIGAASLDALRDLLARPFDEVEE